MSLFGVELNQQVDKIITETRLNLQKQKFIPNFRTIYRSLAQFDQNISGVLPPHLFEKALNQNTIFLKKVELTILQKAFGAGKGDISWFQFLQTLKVPLNQKRKSLLLQIFAFLSQQHEALTPEHLLQHFDASDIQLVKTKKITVEAAKEQLISLLFFTDGKLSEEEFVAFYDDLSLNFPHDEPFAKYVSKQWGFTPEAWSEARQEGLRSIIKALRFKLIQKSKGTSDEFLLRKLFNQFDQNKNGYISAFQLDVMLKKLELPIGAEMVEPLLQKLDKNQSGFIEYDQFKKFIFFDPYPA